MKQYFLDWTAKKQTIEIDEDTEILGLVIAENNDEYKLHLDVVHKKPGIKSETRIKAVMKDQSKFDFWGNIVIKSGASQVDAYLKAEVLMLSDSCHAHAVPALEISETDVKGGHGATIGKPNPDQIFYLQSKGLNYEAAIDLLVGGFIYELEQMANAENRSKIAKLKGISNA